MERSQNDQAPGINDKVIPTVLLNLIANLLNQQQIDPKRLTRGTGLSLAELQNSDSRISFRQVCQLIENGVALSGDPGFGLTVAAHENISTFGLLGYALASCANLGEALQMIGNYYPTTTSMGDLLRFTENGQVILQLDTLYPAGNALPFIIEETFGGGLNIMRSISGTSIIPSELRLSYTDPGYVKRYREHFKCPVHFGTASNQLVLDAAILEDPFPDHNPASAQLAVQLCDQLMQDRDDSNSLVLRVRQVVLSRPGNIPTMNDVATTLHMSERTLRRKLTEQGLSYQSVIDEARQKVATEYLQSSGLPLEDIAYLVGFSDAGNFSRSFKKWTGSPPSAFRRH